MTELRDIRHAYKAEKLWLQKMQKYTELVLFTEIKVKILKIIGCAKISNKKK